MEDGPVAPLPTMEPISRPSSTATTASEAIAQLPGISALATGNSATSSPQVRPSNAPIPGHSQGPTPLALAPATSNMVSLSPHATVPTAAGTLPTCQNCQTSTTPLWRRDEMGSVLCNACGLFLKLHGRPRPISLKTDVIKSRNRVKTVRTDMHMKKKQSLSADPTGTTLQDAATAVALANARRTSQQKANGHDDTNSPDSRNITPSMYDPHLSVFGGMDGQQYQSPSLPQYPMPAGGSPGRPASPLNGESHLDVPDTREQLIAANSSLKTRVSELDLINELYRGRLTQLEADQQNSDNLRHQADEALKNEVEERQRREESQRKHEETQRQLDDSHRRENILKRRLDEMEQELKDATEKIERLEKEAQIQEERPAKKARTEEPAKEETEAAPTPKSTL